MCYHGRSFPIKFFHGYLEDENILMVVSLKDLASRYTFNEICFGSGRSIESYSRENKAIVFLQYSSIEMFTDEYIRNICFNLQGHPGTIEACEKLLGLIRKKPTTDKVEVEKKEKEKEEEEEKEKQDNYKKNKKKRRRRRRRKERNKRRRI